MDIRYVDKNIFDVDCESIVYFTDNSLIGKESDILIKRAGERALECIQKLNGCATGEIKIIPGFDLKQNYIFLSVLPNSLKDLKDTLILKRLFNNLFKIGNEYNVNSFAIDVSYMETRYGHEYIKLLNNVVSLEQMKYSENILYLCK